VKWGGLVVTVMLAVLWIASGWGVAGVGGPGFGVYFTEGDFQVGWWPPGSIDNMSPTSFDAEFDFRRPALFRPQGLVTLVTASSDLVPLTWDVAEGFPLYPSAPTPKGTARSISVHAWFLPVLSIIPSAIAWHRDRSLARRLKQGHCPHCAFDLTGLAQSAPCPDAATPATSKPDLPKPPAAAQGCSYG
jgi:hypothetical protein